MCIRDATGCRASSDELNCWLGLGTSKDPRDAGVEADATNYAERGNQRGTEQYM